jgi:hypothetical protein
MSDKFLSLRKRIDELTAQRAALAAQSTYDLGQLDSKIGFFREALGLVEKDEPPAVAEG